MMSQLYILRMSQLFDMYRIRLDAQSAEPELAAENPGDVLSWLTDADFQIRGSAVRIHLSLQLPGSSEDMLSSCRSPIVQQPSPTSSHGRRDVCRL